MHLFPNGKKYIGITSKRPEARWENGSGYDKDKQPVVYNAIQKYGWDNIEHIILFNNLSQEEAQLKEIELIDKYKTNVHKYGNDYGHNMTDGGEGATGRIISEDSKLKMSKARIGKYKGDDCYKSKAVICDGIRYPSTIAFCNEHNLIRATVEKWLNGKAKMQAEWFDRGLRYENQIEEIKRQERSSSKPIVYDGVYFKSQRELADYLGLCPAAICKKLNEGKTRLDRIPNCIMEYDGKIFESQAKLAEFLGVKKGTLWAWLKYNHIPKKYLDKGLKRVN